MAMIKCPECGKEVSDKTYKCPNCGVVINKPKRGVTGVIFKTIFILFNAIMILWFIGLFMTGSGDPEMANAEATAKAVGSGMLFFIWILIGLPLGIMNYITRPKAYD